MSLPLRLKEPTRETLAKAIVVVLPTLAYLNSFSGAFVFDDEVNILKNPSIRHLGSLGAVLSPPALSGAGGRPLTNLSLALNYALSGSQEWSYHALSLAIHLGCALLLFAILRETFRSPRLPPALIGQSVVIAGTAATLWAVHPVQTATVTYLSQRTEELMALFYLLLLWCFIRLVQTGQRRWWCGAIAAAAAGMASKETMVTAPLVLFLYDRTFLADSLAQAWAKRGRFHASVAATWAILAYFVVRTHLEQRGVGFALGIKSTTYLLAECRAVMTYLKLSVWPHPLVFDYGPVFSADAAAALPYAIPLALALAGTGWLLARNQPAGFGLGWFFIVLAPTSSIIPIIQQPIAENRMYLPLAGLLAVLTAALFRWIGPRGLWLAVAAAVAAAAATAARNQVYASEEHLWTETAAAYPANPRADFALGHLLARTGRDAEAVAKFEKAIRIAPSYIDAHTQLGVVLLRQGRVADAVRQFRQALILRPESVEARVDLGTALKTAGRYREAIEEFESALRLEPDLGAAHYDLALALQATGPDG
jgi:tetratricopeptide (TPR) repeat protein